MYVRPWAEEQALVADIAAGDLATCQVWLCVDDIVPTPATVLGDLTEATFVGYAHVAVTPGLPFRNPDTLDAGFWFGSAQFHYTSGAPQTCYTWALVSTVGGNHLVAAGRLTTPKVFGDPADGLLVLVPFTLRDTADVEVID